MTSKFTIDIKGQLNSIRLAESKALWPLFEAVVNSIQAIEDSPNQKKGEIVIQVHREAKTQEALSNSHVLEKIESFTIIDNGIGLNVDNYNSFNTAYSTLKVKKGCKGIGRFLWLKAFDTVEIHSIFQEDGIYKKRNFVFSENGIQPEQNLCTTDKEELKTEIKLNNLKSPYKATCPVELDVIAKKIIEHCLLFFLAENCPKITITDTESDTINLNHYFNENIKDSLHQDKLIVNEKSFSLYHLKVPEGASSHEIHLCANMQEVLSFDLKKHIPDLQKKIYSNDLPIGFYYVGYLTGEYLDLIVNTTRTGFDFDEKDSQLSLSGTGKDSLLSIAIEYIKTYLSEELDDIQKSKRKQIDTYVANERPLYRYLLKEKPEIYDIIPAKLKPADLEMELHRHVQNWETEIKEQGEKLNKSAKKMIDELSYKELFEKHWANVSKLSQIYLAEYVVRRKTLLSILEEALTIQDNGNFKKEEVIHSIICPMRHTSDDVAFEEMNLWIIDERLAYHKYLASDKSLKSMPVLDSQSRKEPDIAIFDQAIAYSDGDEPFSSITIIEFKKPDNDSKNPMNQVGEYIDLIRSGKKKKANGQSFNVTDGTVFRCYIICDLTEKMRIHCINSSLLQMPDNLGYSGYNHARHAYYEVISYNKLLADAKKRNDILFDKLFTPKLSEILHIPND